MKITEANIIEALRDPESRLYKWSERRNGKDIAYVFLSHNGAMHEVSPRLVARMERDGIIETESKFNTTYWRLK